MTQAIPSIAPRERAHAAPWIQLSYVLLGIAALTPRILNLGAWINIDEASYWLTRSEIFLGALSNADFATTAVTSHPGVTTMWLGSAGLILRRTLGAWGVLHDPAFPTVLTLMRLPVVLTHVAGILAGYALLRRLLAASTALLAALLWATDPFVIGYSRLLHVDGLTATFGTLALLSACVYCREQRRRWLVVAGICAGLATLSKLPGVLVVGAIGFAALLSTWGTPGSYVMRLRRLAPELGLFVAVWAITMVIVWPALWADPARVAWLVRFGVENEGGQRHQGGNYFLGRIVDDPGLLFYPVALAMRLTPWATVGLLAIPLAWRRARECERLMLVSLGGYVVLVALALSLFTNKLNRYIIPAFPAVNILAAVGLTALAPVVTQSSSRALLRPAAFALSTAITAAAMVSAIRWHTYGVAYFNPLLGGHAAGVRTFMVGSGEAMDQVARWLNAQPDITRVKAVSTQAQTLQPYLRPGAEARDLSYYDDKPEEVGYMVDYLRREQLQVPASVDVVQGRVAPLATISVHGVDYAWIYQAPPRVETSLTADFGQELRLWGYSVTEPAGRGGQLVFQLAWERREAPGTDYWLFAHLIGPDGQRIAQSDLGYPTTRWSDRTFHTVEAAIPIPADVPMGEYRLVIGLYDPATGERLPVRGPSPIDPSLDGPNALMLGVVQVE